MFSFVYSTNASCSFPNLVFLSLPVTLSDKPDVFVHSFFSEQSLNLRAFWSSTNDVSSLDYSGKDVCLRTSNQSLIFEGPHPRHSRFLVCASSESDNSHWSESKRPAYLSTSVLGGEGSFTSDQVFWVAACDIF